MANPKHVSILKKGVEAWNRWRKQNPSIAPDLGGANLSLAKLITADLSGTNLNGADLRGAYLGGANLGSAFLGGADLSVADFSRTILNRADLGGANLERVDLTHAHLTGANLTGVNLIEANLTGANFTEANLEGANLEGADLGGANLEGTDLSRTKLIYTNFTSTKIVWTNFTESIMMRTVLADVDLSQAKGLERVRHAGPSTIGTDTLERSQGRIPDIFLRGMGLSDDFIVVIRAMGGAIQFYSCFISYSSKDQLFAERLYADLQARGVRCWFAPHDVQGGKKLHEQIDDAIQIHERLLLILSPNSIDSEWVKTEIIKASKRERAEKRRMLFPVRLKISYEKLKKWECFDGDTGKDLAREIREYYIPDFSQWESPEKLKEEFEKLVRDLKKAAGKAGAEAG